MNSVLSMLRSWMWQMAYGWFQDLLWSVQHFVESAFTSNTRMAVAVTCGCASLLVLLVLCGGVVYLITQLASPG